ncbi:nuclease domain-containing protein [Pararobbsia alpina]|uniref:DUF1364 family protein n=1 Tax=Pararobbsia alpina TaxID=621374 RepID=A0A6S7CP83_9BURK|nr:nuclease domain-containing protein [Pararobbsia alpina]CAB3784451.1 hypothetical protein LMG28138_01812 [Pararobbsia alpina]
MRRSGLARTGFKRKQGAPLSSFKPGKPFSGKPKRKKPTVADGSKYLAACRGEPCFLSVFGVCLHDSATVVPCHSNQSRHGKGMGIKAKHEYSVPGCRACHVFIDQGPATREFKFKVWDDAYERWEPARAAKLGIEIEQQREAA